MSDAAVVTVEAPAPGCTCCKPPARSVDDEIRELRTRHDELERRLAGLAEAQR